MAYGKLMKKIRNGKGMSLRTFGKLVDVDYSHLARLEKEESTKGKEKLSPSIDILRQICDRADYPFRQFLEEAGYIEPPPPSRIQILYDQMTEPQRQLLVEFALHILETNGNTHFDTPLDFEIKPTPNA